MGLVLGYCRVSPSPKAREARRKGLLDPGADPEWVDSIEAQEARIRAYCTFAGLPLSEVLRDQCVSAAASPLRDRPEGRRLFATGVEHVVAFRLDRLFRDTIDGLTSLAAWTGTTRLHLVAEGGQTLNTATATGKLIVTQLLAFASYERDVTVERTVAALAHKKSKGERTGGIPYGCRLADDRTTLLPEPRELAMIARARELREGGASLRAIGAALEAEGYLPRNGRHWHAEQISGLLR